MRCAFGEFMEELADQVAPCRPHLGFSTMLNRLRKERTPVRWIVVVVAAVEAAATSLILILSPSLFGWLILGAQLSEAGQALGASLQE